jgi:hypothetical protein
MAEAAWLAYLKQYPPAPGENVPEAVWKAGWCYARGLRWGAAWIYCTLASAITLFVLIAWAAVG